MRLDKLFGLLSGLSGTDRFSNAKLIHRESVLEHIGSVVLMCYFITRELKVHTIGCIDEADVLAKAAVHDVEEILVGDIPRTTKHSSVEAERLFAALEIQVMEKIAADLELSRQPRAWFIEDHAKAKAGDEGLIVELADVLAVVYKVHEEAVERGNVSMLSRATTCGNQLTKVSNRVKATGWPIESKNLMMNLVVQAQQILTKAGRHGGTFTIEEGAAE